MTRNDLLSDRVELEAKYPFESARMQALAGEICEALIARIHLIEKERQWAFSG